MFNKNPVQESLKTLCEVLLLKNYCALFWCLYIACQVCKTSKSESRIITVSKWVWRLKIVVVMHSRKAHRDSWFIMLIPMWSSSLSQAFTATIYVSELWVAFEIVRLLWYIRAWSNAISLVTVKSWVLPTFHAYTGCDIVPVLATERGTRLWKS